MRKSKGLGDTIAKITKATGIKKVVEFIAGDDCGCDARQEALNKLFPYKPTECLVEDEYEYLTKYFKNYPDQTKGTRPAPVLRKLYSIYNRVFKSNKKPSSCSSCVRTVLNQLKTVYGTYNI